MAMINRNSLVLPGVNVVRDVVAGTMGFGRNLASYQMPAMPFSVRHPSQVPQAEQKTGLRHDHAERGMDDAADRAGRPGCSVILASRSSAPAADLATGGSSSTAAWRLHPFTGRFQASVGVSLAERLLALRGRGQRTSGHLGRLCAPAARKHATAGIKPAETRIRRLRVAEFS
jgi:hypothetical protein